MRILRLPTFFTLSSLAALSLSAHAQTQEETSQNSAPRDSACVQELERLAQRMGDDGYWLAGYPGATAGGYGTRYPYGTAEAMNRGAAPEASVKDQADVNGTPHDAAADAGVDPAITPWAGVTWQHRPQYEIGVLYRAANVLTANGDEETCATLVDAAEQQYDNYARQLSELGVEPEDVSSWRQAEIATAISVDEAGFPRRIEDIIGADVRNAQDKDLGDVKDVAINPESGDVQYLVVSSGGFFGIGDEDVIVPWEHLHVTPRLGTFVLPVEQAAMEQAPRPDFDDRIDGRHTGSTDIGEINSYWREVIGETD